MRKQETIWKIIKKDLSGDVQSIEQTTLVVTMLLIVLAFKALLVGWEEASLLMCMVALLIFFSGMVAQRIVNTIQWRLG